MQQIYRRTPMPKCDFNKVALQFSWNRTSIWVFSCKFAAYFQNTFSIKHLWRAASGSSKSGCINPFHSTGFRSRPSQMFFKIGVLKGLQLNEKETYTQVFSEHCELFKIRFFTEHLWWLLLYRKPINWFAVQVNWLVSI